MKSTSPDIVVISPDGEYLIIVEVRLKDSAASGAFLGRLL
jgi:hypothetical protein